MTEHKVESVERALTILEAFSDGTEGLTLGELAARTQLYRSTILRLASSLERFGYLRRDAAGVFHLGSSLYRLGVLYQNGFSLGDFVRPLMRDLTNESGQNSAFFVREGDWRICLFWQRALHAPIYSMDQVTHLPLHTGAAGHVLTAYTSGTEPIHDTVRRDGYRISLGEREPNAAGIAAPVFGHGNAFVGALALIGLRHHFEGPTQESLRDMVIRYSQRLTETLRTNQPRPAAR